MTTAHPWRAEEDTRNQEEEEENDAGDPKTDTDARGEEKTESETGETRERQGEEPHAEQSFLGQLTPEDRPEEGKRNPETPRHRHPGAGTPDRDPGGTAGSEPEDTPLGNPDIRIPITEMTTAHPWRAEEDTRNQEEEEENDAGDPKTDTDARGEEKTESETGETRERQGEEPHTEQSFLGQLTPEDRPEEGKRNPETPRHRHVPGGAWLQQSTLPHSPQILSLY
ncbi:hypothetical protein NDU88_004724 [Pleurodeles waltl]|uniref:Uncharacterized protein n=1 Tax=Pleurodeles waltl TaxID=8319 RepID=A0AAV7TTD3_PLEWA|nr:hypothetical protein NDU88_004724 [Pleurodeles waltl]